MEAFKGKIEFVEDPRGGGDPGDHSFLLPEKKRRCAFRTRSRQEWPREAFIDKEADNLHIISFDADRGKYLLESAIRLGMSYERQETEWAVEEVKDQLGGEVESTQQVVELMADDLTYVVDAFPPDEPVAPPARSNPPLDKDDILFGIRGARGLNEEKRAIIRTLLAQDPVEKNDLPEGVLTLTST
jgi:hypothetical protein